MSVDTTLAPQGALLRPLATRRMLQNLVDNAIRYGRPPINLVARQAGNQLVLEVLDRGEGIPPEAVERMLQPFTRLDMARGGGGTGLGLAIVDRIAQMHGGQLELLPREGGGLLARVWLPLTAA